MSTQLILYPQDYQGYSYNPIYEFNIYTANSYFTSNLNNVGGPIDIGQVVAFQLGLISVPMLYNSGGWMGFHSATTGANWGPVAAPNITGGVLRIHAQNNVTAYGTICGVAQRIDGLTIGTNYDLTFDHQNHSGRIDWWIGGNGAGTQDFIGNNGSTSRTTINNTLTSQVVNFDATATSMHLVLAARGLDTVHIDVTNIIITESITGAEVTFTDINDGQVICDLYEEEEIPLTLNVDNFTNVIEKPQSYSKSFDLPNTKRNAKIFTHIFDITKTIETVYDFNPYVQTRAVLKQNGVLIFEGTLKLIDIKDKEGEISYNVNLFASSIALKEILESRTFADLTDVISELEHNYNFTNIDNSWNDILSLTNPLPTGTFAGTVGASTTDVLKYPFVDWGGMINCTGTEPSLDTLEQAFRPCISVLYLIKNIFRQAGFEYTSSFFDTDTNFANLYMDFNWGANNAPNDWSSLGALQYISPTGDFIGTSDTIIIFDSNTVDSSTGWDDTTYTFTSPADNTSYTISCEVWFQNVTSVDEPVEVWWENDGAQVPGTYATIIVPGSGWKLYAYNTTFTAIVNNGDLLNMKAKATNLNRARQPISDPATNPWFVTTASVSVANNDSMVRGTLVNTLRGELGQWDFLKSIMTMFNLISMPDPDDSTKILIEPYPDVFGTAAKVQKTTRDWTYKLDIKDIKLEPLQLKKEIIFKYGEDDDDHAFKQYKTASNSYLYGSKIVNGSTAIPGTNQLTNLIGKDEVEVEAFAATICKPIQDVFPNFRIPVIYSANDDGTFEGFDNMPRLLLWNGITANAPADWQCPAQNGVAAGLKTEYGQMTHVSAVPSTSIDYDVNFGSCQIFIGTSPLNNLYNLYYSEYFDELYNPNTRILTAKLSLTAADINTFRFYDIIILKNRQFKVNKINYKPNSLSTVEFILIT